MTSSLSDVTTRRAHALEQAHSRARHLKAVNDTAETTTMYLYGPVSAWSWMDDAVTAKNVIKALKDIDTPQIDVHLNSPGGDVIEGVAIMNALSNHPARIVIHVDALAASAASYIAQAGDEIVMGRGSQMMIHDASMLTWGNPEQLHEDADWLDKQSQNIASIYADRAGGTADQWRALMRAETWYTAAEAVAAGLADRVAAKGEQIDPDAESTVPGGDSDAAGDAWDLSAFTYAGRRNAPAPVIPAAAAQHSVTRASHEHHVHKLLAAPAAGFTPPVAPASGDTTQEGAADVFTDEQLTNLRQKLGVAADADAGLILGALDEALQEQVDDDPAAGSTPVVPEGMTLIENDQLDALQGDAARGRQAREDEETQAREDLVATAVRDGRISAARRDHWVARLAADEGEADVLASLPTIVPLDEVGHAVSNTDEVSDTYTAVYGAEQKGA